MAFAKCMPHNVEGIMLGLIGSIIKINSDIIARLLGIMFINGGDVTVTKEEYTGLSASMYKSVYLCFGCLLSFKFVFDRNEFEDLQKLIQ